MCGVYNRYFLPSYYPLHMIKNDTPLTKHKDQANEIITKRYFLGSVQLLVSAIESSDLPFIYSG